MTMTDEAVYGRAAAEHADTTVGIALKREVAPVPPVDERHDSGRAAGMQRSLAISILAAAFALGCAPADQTDGGAPTGNGAATAGSTTPPPRAATPDTAAGAEPAGTAGSERRPTLTIHFSRGESTVAVSREATPGGNTLEAALRQLLRGPTASERAAGIHSWFSDTTAGALRSATVDQAGRAVVDFTDLRTLIPNASTSAGSGMLLRELNGTVFEFPQVESVEYRIEGSCAAFFEWLQYQCEVVPRP